MRVPCLVKDVLFCILGSVKAPSAVFLLRSLHRAGPPLSFSAEPSFLTYSALVTGLCYHSTLYCTGKHGIRVRDQTPFSKLIEHSLSGEINMSQKTSATVQIMWSLASVSFPQKAVTVTTRVSDSTYIFTKRSLGKGSSLNLVFFKQ